MTAYLLNPQQHAQIVDAIDNGLPEVRAAAHAMLKSMKPQTARAYITETTMGPMVWTPEMYGEACTYCDDDEFPEPLYTLGDTA